MMLNEKNIPGGKMFINTLRLTEKKTNSCVARSERNEAQWRLGGSYSLSSVFTVDRRGA
jgi:muconolactone delta-isomerase